MSNPSSSLSSSDVISVAFGDSVGGCFAVGDVRNWNRGDDADDDVDDVRGVLTDDDDELYFCGCDRPDCGDDLVPGAGSDVRL